MDCGGLIDFKGGFMRGVLILWMGILGAVLLNPPVLASSASFYYSDGPWMGRVIDAETKEPIEGAVVLAVWNKVYGTPTGNQSYFFDAVEVLTNKEGKFFIKKYRAINILPIIRWIEGPYFTIFKPGYTPFGHNIAGSHYFQKYFPNSPLRVDAPTLTEMFKRDIVIELLKLKTKEERLDVLPSSADPFGNYDSKKKNYLKLLNLERSELGLELYPIKGD